MVARAFAGTIPTSTKWTFGVMRVVPDTNVLLISIGKYSPCRPIFDELLADSVGLVVTNDMVFEYLEILALHSTPEISAITSDLV